MKKISPINKMMLPSQNTKLNPGSLLPDLKVNKLKSKAIAPQLKKTILAVPDEMYERPTPAKRTKPIKKAIAKKIEAKRFNIIL